MTAEQFDTRYAVAPRFAGDPAARQRAELVVRQQLQHLAKLTHRPGNIGWFEKQVVGPLDQRQGTPLIGYFCNTIPVEVAYALGARPVQLGCGNPALVQPGEEVLSGEICPLAKSSFATFLTADGTPRKCAAVVIPTSCDAKKKLGEIVADFRPTFMLNLPPEQNTARYLRLAVAEVERMATFLADVLGRRLRRRDLLAAIELTRHRSVLVRRLQTARAANPAALSVRDFFIIIQASFAGADLTEWLHETTRVISEVEAAGPSHTHQRTPLILTGAPIFWPNFKPLNLIEECGADVVADTLCTGAQSCFDPVVCDEHSWSALWRALAQRYIFASPCPCFISQATRLSRILDLVAEFKAEGVVNYGLRLCPLFDMEVYRLSRILKERRIPFANMRTDYSLEDTEQLRVRLEAFLETVGAGT